MQILKPKVFVESVGFAFLYPLCKLFGCHVVSYVHYPTISSDMLKHVESRKSSFNNRSFVANSSFLSTLKLQYYRLFSIMYGFVGSFCDKVMVNSSWTSGHIKEIWKNENKTSIVFPPCDTGRLSVFPLGKRKRIILSVAQFRPEKDHQLQIEILSSLYQKYPQYKSGPDAIKLVLIGSVRNGEDQKLVDDVEESITKFGLKVSLAHCY